MTVELDEKRLEAVCTALCASRKFETGQGGCAPICMEMLGSSRPNCGHKVRVHGELAEAAIRAYEEAAPKGEVVAWQHRVKSYRPDGGKGTWSHWMAGRAEGYRPMYEVEERPLYLASPPADADLIRELVVAWGTLEDVNEWFAQRQADEQPTNTEAAIFGKVHHTASQLESALTRARKAGYGEAG